MPEPISAPTPAPTSSTASSSAPVASPASTPASMSTPSALASFERVAAAASELPAPTAPSATGTGDGTSTGGATTPSAAAAGTTSVLSTTPDGTPEHRIEAAVRNAREQMEQELGWARSYGSREDVDRAVAQIRALDANPLAFYRQLTDELREAGLLPADASPAAAEPTLTDPTPDLRSTDGKEAFSAGAVRTLVDNAIARTKQELLGVVEPALAFTRTSQQQQHVQALRQQAETEARDTMAEMKSLPHFTEHKDAIRDAYLAIPAQEKSRYGMRAALYKAYNTVLATTVLPTLQSRVQSTTVDDLRRAATAGTMGAPASAAPPTKPSIKDGDVDALARHMETLSSRMSQAV